VIEMPLVVGGTGGVALEQPERATPAPVVGIRLMSNTDRRAFKLVGLAVMLAILATLLALTLFRVGEVRQRVVFTGQDQSFLELTGRDDYLAVVQKLGAPTFDRWQNESGAIQLRALSYPDRKYTVVLMGSDRHNALYIGALDDQWRPIHSVQLHSGGTTDSLLRGLKRF
jgi:hypothetical protein